MVLELLMTKICDIIGFSKIELFKFSGNERVKQNQTILKTIENFLRLYVNHFPINFNKFRMLFCFSTETWIIPFPAPC